MDSFADRQDKLPGGQLPKPQILGVGGSPRKGGNSDILLQHILHNIGEPKQLRDLQFQSCIGCEKCRKDKICTGLQDGMSLLYPEIIMANGLVLVSPTHNYNITALMKAFIDRPCTVFTTLIPKIVPVHGRANWKIKDEKPL